MQTRKEDIKLYIRGDRIICLGLVLFISAVLYYIEISPSRADVMAFDAENDVKEVLEVCQTFNENQQFRARKRFQPNHELL